MYCPVCGKFRSQLSTHCVCGKLDGAQLLEGPASTATRFDYDNKRVTITAGILGSWFFAGLVAYFFHTESINFHLLGFALPPIVLLGLAGVFVATGTYWVLLGWRRRANPHCIEIRDDGILLPISRLSNDHIFIPYSKIEVLTAGTLEGYRLIDVHFRGKRYRIIEILFMHQRHFDKVVEALIPDAWKDSAFKPPA